MNILENDRLTSRPFTESNTEAYNIRSQQVLKHNGFIYESILHQDELIYDGYLYDHQCHYPLNPVAIK